MKITDGRDAQHPLLRELVAQLPDEDGEWTPDSALAAFWGQVEAVGTPLLTPSADESVLATFVYRDEPKEDIDRVVLNRDGAGYADLALLAGTDVWFVELVLPVDYAGLYCFHLGVNGELLDEDVHEPWAASFADEFHREAVREVDAIYVRHILRVAGRKSPVPSDRTDIVTTSADLLGTPRPLPSFPVHVLRPALTLTQPLPIILVMNGQFWESSDLGEQLAHAMSEGVLPPALIVVPGAAHGGSSRSAWGWRNGYGPHNLAPYLHTELLPALTARYPLTGEIHLVAWDYTASAALRTAHAVPAISSVTLFEPEGLVSDGYDDGATHRAAEFAEMARLTAELLENGRIVQISQLSPRSRQDSSHQPGEVLARQVAELTDHPFARVDLPDQNIVSAAGAVVPALARVLNHR